MTEQRRIIHWAALLVLLCCTFTASAHITVKVAAGSLNRFTFRQPFNQLVLPPHTELASKPVSMKGNTTLLISLEDDMTEPVQMVVQLAGGEVLDFLLVPGAGKAAEWKQPGDVDSGNTPHPQDQALIDLFSEVLADPNRKPSGFKTDSVPEAGHINGLTADYIAHYVNQTYHLLVMRLRSDKRNPILPQDLYVHGVAAVYIDGDAVGPDVAPLAIVLKAK